MALPQPFSTVAPINAVVDFTDFEDGVGYVSYQGYNSETTAGSLYHLNSNNIHSDQVETTDTTTGVGTTPTFAKSLDLDFDTSAFTIPRVINGNVITNTTLGFIFNTANNVSFRAVVELSIVDASGATLIGTSTSRTYVVSSHNAWKSINFTTPFAVDNKIVQEGQWLRLTVQFWGHTAVSGSAVDTAIGHSPFNLDGTAIIPTTQESNYNQTILNVPFKIE